MDEVVKKSTFSMKVTVVTVFLFLSSLIVILALSLQYYFSQGLAKDAASTAFNRTANGFSEKIDSLNTQTSNLINVLSHFPQIDQEVEISSQHSAREVIAQAMLKNNNLYGIYIGYGNGDFYELINLGDSENLKLKHGATAEDSWLVVKIYEAEGGRERLSEYYDSNFNLTHSKVEPATYYANKRPWYRKAISNNEVVKTAPYLFHNLQTPGVTYAKRIKNTNSVIAADISLASLSAFLAKNNSDGEAMIFDTNGRIHAHSFELADDTDSLSTQPIELTVEEKQYLGALGAIRIANKSNWPPFDFSYSGLPQGYATDMISLMAKKLGLGVKYVNGYSWEDLNALYLSGNIDVLQSVTQLQSQQGSGLTTAPYLELSSAIVTRKDTKDISSLEQLDGKSLVISVGSGLADVIERDYPNINVFKVKDSLSALKAVENRTADASLEFNRVADYLVGAYSLNQLKVHPELTGFNHTLSMMVNVDQKPLVSLLNKAMASISDTEKQSLEKKWLEESGNKNSQNDNIARSLKAGIVPFSQLVNMAKQSETNSPVLETIKSNGKSYTLYVQRVEASFGSKEYVGFVLPTEIIQAPYMDKVNKSTIITFGAMLLVLPVLLFFSNIIVRPVRALFGESEKIKQRDFNKVKRVPSWIAELSALSDSMFSMSRSIEQYEKNQQELMDSLVKLIAQAIDDKSPYTAGHCERVPILAIELAKAANKSHLPAFKGFKLKTEEEWREFEIAAWLHDCGKVTTPEHIVDKGTKLEAIFNRIHLVRMRFEVLLREAEIDYWKGIESGEDADELKRKLSQRQEQIKDDFAFVAQCNVGGEFMSEEHLERLKQIAAQTWVRNLDDRLGLSPEESRRMEDIPPQNLPCEENLLSDKPEHLIAWPQDPNSKIGDEIKMRAPEYQANQGELHNLSIGRGTLTAEDRYRINEHIVSTIRMLEALPLPDELKRVPEYAGGHHETLRGDGYPKQLSADELPTATRILAIADVFEALTASDRPYKKAKPLSEALKILNFMVEDGHLDKDLFELMLRNNLHIEYAKTFLPEEQIDVEATPNDDTAVGA
ncbi:HD domain-containing phosphohydrolase [Vibrio sp. EA2]|uniref:HD domain-containing phosphohydrolase n=1 Tax=Vibrio sp. EA2 TaxID=3079860 RepID=UPI0029495A67|nr:HD domain-containing phosphohydrolase [Vibrio sp. EA2]MDV6249881.1 transporter substrate-binding domain-containing protein [Vibrio sp. EA2]